MAAMVVMPQTRLLALETCLDPPLSVFPENGTPLVIKGDVVTVVGSG